MSTADGDSGLLVTLVQETRDDVKDILGRLAKLEAAAAAPKPAPSGAWVRDATLGLLALVQVLQSTGVIGGAPVKLPPDPPGITAAP